jgi:AcrR family transcriptional regulator
MAKARPKRPSADITRSKILNAALTLFMQHGYAGTSMAKLA